MKIKPIFYAITKVDVEQRLVWGVATAEKVDQSNEICDYEGSKPYFEAWSAKFAKRTGGSSLGNVRAMHQPIAAGKLVEMTCDDATKTISVCAKVVDDAEWKKVLEGVYTGFSQGGKYIKRWADKVIKGAVRFIADPMELSLVDNPCLDCATFTAVKGAGIEAPISFQIWIPENDAVAARAEEMAKAAGTPEAWPDLVDDARSALVAEYSEKALGADQDDGGPDVPVLEEPGEIPTPEVEKVIEGDPAPEPDPAEVEKAVTDDADDWGIDQVFRVRADATIFERKPEAKKHVEALKTIKAAGSTSPLAIALAKAKAAAAGTGRAPAEDPATVAQLEDAAAALEEIGKAFGDKLGKGLWTLSSFAEIIARLISLQRETAWERESENDESTVPESIASGVTALASTFLTMAQEEIAEALADLKTLDIEVDIIVLEAAVRGIDLVKADAALMDKAKQSKADRTQAIHDHASAMGAKCAGADKILTPELEAEMTKLQEENVALKSAQDAAVPEITTLGEDMAKMRADLDAANKRIEDLAKLPEPMPTIDQSGGKLVGKVSDDPLAAALAEKGGVIDKQNAGLVLGALIKQMGPEAVRGMLLDAALSNPVHLGA